MSEKQPLPSEYVTNQEIKKDSLSEFNEKLKEVNLKFLPITDEQINLLHNRAEPNNVRHPYDPKADSYNETQEKLGLYYGSEILGFTNTITSYKRSIEYEPNQTPDSFELSLVTVDPEVQNLKLGKLMVFEAYKEALKKGVQKIGMRIADDTGKMEKLATTMGMVEGENIRWVKGYGSPAWDRVIENDEKRNELIELLEKQINELLGQLKMSAPKALESFMEKIKLDDPRNIENLTEYIQEKLNYTDLLSLNTVETIYGYPNSIMRIFRGKKYELRPPEITAYMPVAERSAIQREYDNYVKNGDPQAGKYPLVLVFTNNEKENFTVDHDHLESIVNASEYKDWFSINKDNGYKDRKLVQIGSSIVTKMPHYSKDKTTLEKTTMILADIAEQYFAKPLK